LITTSLEAVGTPALQSPGVFQLAVPSVQVSGVEVMAVVMVPSIVARGPPRRIVDTAETLFFDLGSDS